MLFDFKIKKQYRLPGYDYSWDGYYFVTICVKNSHHFFGEVVDGRMRLSPIGKIAKRKWKRIPKSYGCVKLDRFIVMPNHMHGIIIIDSENVSRRNAPPRNAPRRRNAPWRVRTRIFGPMIKNSLSSIINHYKGAVKKECNKKGFTYFFWQSRFHDYIIRNDKELFRIQRYIINNPFKWEIDRNNENNSHL